MPEPVDLEDLLMQSGPIHPQLALVLERLNNSVGDIHELRGQVAAVHQALLVVTAMQRDVQHQGDKLARLFDLADQHQAQINELRAAAAANAKLQKMVGAVLMACVGVIGWGITKVELLAKVDNRVTTLELLANRGEIERAMSDRPAAATQR